MAVDPEERPIRPMKPEVAAMHWEGTSFYGSRNREAKGGVKVWERRRDEEVRVVYVEDRPGQGVRRPESFRGVAVVQVGGGGGAEGGAGAEGAVEEAVGAEEARQRMDARVEEEGGRAAAASAVMRMGLLSLRRAALLELRGLGRRKGEGARRARLETQATVPGVRDPEADGRRAWQAFDTLGRGFLTRHTFQVCLEGTGLLASHGAERRAAICAAQFVTADVDGDGVVTPEDFVALFRAYGPEAPAEGDEHETWQEAGCQTEAAGEGAEEEEEARETHAAAGGSVLEERVRDAAERLERGAEEDEEDEDGPEGSDEVGAGGLSTAFGAGVKRELLARLGLLLLDGERRESEEATARRRRRQLPAGGQGMGEDAGEWTRERLEDLFMRGIPLQGDVSMLRDVDEATLPALEAFVRAFDAAVREVDAKLRYSAKAAAQRNADLLPLLPEGAREQHIRTPADFHRRYVEALASEFSRPGGGDGPIDVDRLIEGFPSPVLPSRAPFVPTEAQVREDLAKSMAAAKQVRADSVRAAAASSAPASLTVDQPLDE